MARVSLVQPRPSPKMDVIFDALEKGWPNSARNITTAEFYILWGLIGNNEAIMNANRANSQRFAFVDMPYFNRWLPGQDLNNSWWRFCIGGVHDRSKLNVTIDRFETFNRRVSPWRSHGEHILICPSSETMTRYMHNMSVESWCDIVFQEIRKQTNRPIKIRHKPRKNGTSGPAAADISIEDDLKNCHALVTSGSLAAVDALMLGVPVFTTSIKHCPTAWCSNTDFSKMEEPVLFDRELLLANLAWKQYTIDEMKSGFCYESVHRLHYH